MTPTWFQSLQNRGSKQLSIWGREKLTDVKKSSQKDREKLERNDATAKSKDARRKMKKKRFHVRWLLILLLRNFFYQNCSICAQISILLASCFQFFSERWGDRTLARWRAAVGQAYCITLKLKSNHASLIDSFSLNFMFDFMQRKRRWYLRMIYITRRIYREIWQNFDKILPVSYLF